MLLIIIFIIFFCLYACKENAQEEIKLYPGFHLEGGLCAAKYLNPSNSKGQPEWTIRLYYCPDSIPPEEIAPLTEENIMKYKQGGLCFRNHCTIEPEKSFTLFMRMPKDVIDSNEYKIFASKDSYNSENSITYKYTKNDSVISYKGYNNTINNHEEHIGYWETLFSMAKPLKIKNENLSDSCNSKFCSTKDFLVGPFSKIECDYGTKQKSIACKHELLKPKCEGKLESLSEEYGILMHSGAFPVEDCDLGNWRYIKINSLSKEHYEKLKDLLKK
jgi:hypothetical protein